MIVINSRTPFLGLFTYGTYSRAKDIRSQGHALYPGLVNSAPRHQWASEQAAKEFGSMNARLLGLGNEIQGFIMHDIPGLRSRLNGTSPWAFQFNDLKDNEIGIGNAGSSNCPKKGQEEWPWWFNPIIL
jgi:hypothetical protein